MPDPAPIYCLCLHCRLVQMDNGSLDGKCLECKRTGTIPVHMHKSLRVHFIAVESVDRCPATIRHVRGEGGKLQCEGEAGHEGSHYHMNIMWKDKRKSGKTPARTRGH